MSQSAFNGMLNVAECRFACQLAMSIFQKTGKRPTLVELRNAILKAREDGYANIPDIPLVEDKPSEEQVNKPVSRGKVVYD